MTTTEPTDAQLDEWEKLTEAATPGTIRGPVVVLIWDENGDPLTARGRPEDALLFLTAREAVPALIAALRREREECARLVAQGCDYDTTAALVKATMRAEAAEAECAKRRERAAQDESTIKGWRRRAEGAEARVRELEAQQSQAEPECVRRFRASGLYRLPPLTAGDNPLSIEDEVLNWIATAPAASVSRLAMRGDALRIVMEWQRGTVERQDELREQFDDAMIVATVLDADAMVPTLRSMKLNGGERYPDCPEEKRLWNELPAEWRALVQ